MSLVVIFFIGLTAISFWLVIREIERLNKRISNLEAALDKEKTNDIQSN